MDSDTFQKQYHDFCVQSESEAVAERDRVNEEAEGFRVVVRHFPPMGYCLMLEISSNFLKGVGI